MKLTKELQEIFFNPKDLPYYSNLLEIRGFLVKELKLFPLNCCQYTTRFLKKELGLKEVGGFYIQNQTPHAWSYDLDLKRYIDLTLDQFSKMHSPIMVLPKKNDLIISDIYLTSNQLMLPDNRFFPDINRLRDKFNQEKILKY